MSYMQGLEAMFSLNFTNFFDILLIEISFVFSLLYFREGKVQGSLTVFWRLNPTANGNRWVEMVHGDTVGV